MQALQDVRALEEERWDAERRCQAETARCAELERELKRTIDEAAERADELAKRLRQASDDVSEAGEKYVDSERMRGERPHGSNLFLIDARRGVLLHKGLSA